MQQDFGARRPLRESIGEVQARTVQSPDKTREPPGPIAGDQTRGPGPAALHDTAACPRAPGRAAQGPKPPWPACRPDKAPGSNRKPVILSRQDQGMKAPQAAGAPDTLDGTWRAPGH